MRRCLAWFVGIGTGLAIAAPAGTPPASRARPTPPAARPSRALPPAHPQAPTKPTPAVQELLDRASGQGPSEALLTLKAARQVAERGHDRSGALAVAEAAMATGELAREREENEPAGELFRLSLALCERVAPRSLAHARALRWLAAWECDAGKLDPAQQRLQQALAIVTTRSSGSLEHASVLARLAYVARERDDLGQSRKLLEQALAIRRKKAPNSPLLAGNLTDLAELIQKQRKDAPETQDLRREALAILGQKQDDSRERFHALAGLFRLAYEEGGTRAAWPHALQALSLRRKRVPGSLALAHSLSAMANMARELEDREGSLRYSRESVALLETAAAPTPLQAQIYGLLALNAKLLDELPTARDLGERAVRSWRQVAPGSLELATALERLGDFAWQQEDHAAASAFYQEALKIRQEKKPDSPEVAELYRNLGHNAYSRFEPSDDASDLAEAMRFYDQARAIYAARDPDSQDLASILWYMGSVAMLQSDLSASRRYFEQALKVFETKGELRTREHAKYLRSAGAAARLQKEFVAAREHYQRAKGILEKVEHGSYEHTETLSRLARTATELGDFAAGREYARQARALLTAVNVPERPALQARRERRMIATEWQILARDAVERGDLEEAWDPTQRARELWERTTPNSWEHARCLALAAEVAYGRSDFVAAQDLGRQALAIRYSLWRQQQAPNGPGAGEGERRRTGKGWRPPGAPEVAESHLLLGAIAEQMGDLTAARRACAEALALYQQNTPESLAHATALSGLGFVLLEQGDLLAAGEEIGRAVAIARKQAPAAYATAAILKNAGVIAYYRQDLAGAQRFFQEAVAIYEKVSPYSLDLLSPVANMGEIAFRQGEFDAAHERLQRALQIAEKHALKSPAVAWTWRLLGDVDYERRDFKSAEESYERAWAICRAVAPDSPAAAMALHGLGTLADRRGRLREAIDRYREALAILEKTAPHHPEAPDIWRDLAVLLGEQDDHAGAMAARQRAETIRAALRSLPPGGPDVETAPVLAVATQIIGGETGDAGAPVGTRVDEKQSLKLRSSPMPARPEVRILAPAAGSEVRGDQVELRLQVFSPLPLKDLTIWINGRPRETVDLAPGANGTSGRGGIIRAKGDRNTVEKELPQYGSLIRDPRNTQFPEITYALRIEPSDGEYPRVDVAVTTTGGVKGPWQRLRLRNPRARGFRGRLHVLAIGIDNYAKLPKLRFATADARDIAVALKAQAGDGRLYRKGAAQVFLGEEATRPAIQKALTALARNAAPDDTLILFVSGHGLKAGDRYYFAPVNADPDRLAETALLWQDMIDVLRRARARNIWVLADCCRAAPGLRATERGLRRAIPPDGNIVLWTASKGDQASYERETLRHGVFAQAWLDVLEGRANPDCYDDRAPWGHIVTLEAVIRHVPRRVLHHSDPQTPQEAVIPAISGGIDATPLFTVVLPRR